MKIVLALSLIVLSFSCSNNEKKSGGTICLANLAEVGRPVLLVKSLSKARRRKCESKGIVKVDSCEGENAKTYLEHLLRNSAGKLKGNRVVVASFEKDSKGQVSGHVFKCKK